MENDVGPYLGVGYLSFLEGSNNEVTQPRSFTPPAPTSRGPSYVYAFYLGPRETQPKNSEEAAPRNNLAGESPIPAFSPSLPPKENLGGEREKKI